MIRILPLAERGLKRGGIFSETTGYFEVKKGGVFSIIIASGKNKSANSKF